MWKRFAKLFILSAAVLLVAAACAKTPAINDSNAAAPEVPTTEAAASTDKAEAVAPSSGADRVVEVELSEFAISAASFEFVPGETVEFIITNSGVVEHEFRMSNQDRVDEHVAGGHADHDDGTMSDEEMAEMDDEMDDDADHDDSDGHHDDDEAAHDDDEAAHDDDEAAHDDDEAAHDDDEAAHDDDGHGDEAEDAVLVLAAGETGTLVFTFPDNDHDYTAAVCLIPGHYEAGMATDLSYGA